MLNLLHNVSRSNKQQAMFLMGFFLLLGVTKTFACVCALMPDENLSDAVKRNVRESTVVFAGKVIGFEYRKGIPNEYIDAREKESGHHIDYETLVVKFQVERWWKGEVTSEIILATDVTRYSNGGTIDSSCDYTYKKGITYLVYASEKDNVVRTNYCSRTMPLADAGEDIKILGKGKQPIKKEEEMKTNISMFTHQ